MNCENNPPGGNPNGSGYENPSGKCHFYREKKLNNEVLFFDLFSRKKQLKYKRKVNVIKWLNQHVRQTSLYTLGPTKWILKESTKWRKYFQISLLFLIQVTNSKILSLTIYLDLLRQNVESNPGMTYINKSTTVSVLTFNCNGLGDKKKLRRLLGKARTIVDKGGIVLLQETHVKDTE